MGLLLDMRAEVINMRNISEQELENLKQLFYRLGEKMYISDNKGPLSKEDFSEGSNNIVYKYTGIRWIWDVRELAITSIGRTLHLKTKLLKLLHYKTF